MALKVNEIFYSIQGESSFAGRPCVFIRLTGCNLRCSYCDTQYAYDDGKKMSINEIIERVASYQCPLVEVTGGEPLIQKATPSLIWSLLEKGYEVLLETNGTQNMDQIDDRCVKIIDIKCPSSGESKMTHLEYLSQINDRDEIKFVIADRQDYEYSKKMMDNICFKSPRINPVHFSPVFGSIDPKVLAKWILEDHLPVRLHLQLQKIVWGPNRRGI